MTFGAIQRLWTKNGGPRQWAPLMAAIAMAESRGDPTVLNNTPATGDYSVGLWQINYRGIGQGQYAATRRNWPNYLPRVAEFGTPEHLLADVDAQAKAAILLFGGGPGITAWQGDPVYQAWSDLGSPVAPSAAWVERLLRQLDLTWLGAPTSTSTLGTPSAGTLPPARPGTPKTPQVLFANAYPNVARPPGFNTTVETVKIAGTKLADLVGTAIVSVSLTLSITKASTLLIALHDPTRTIINHPVLSQASTVTLSTHIFCLQGVEKNGSVLNLTCIPWVVYALEQATGPFAIAPGTMTRTQFAKLLVSQINGAVFESASNAYFESFKGSGYAHTNKEQLSRGTIANPLESSWTALQRLASEIQWVCFESLGTVYFGPYGYLASQTPVASPQEFSGGVTTITFTWTAAQPTGSLTIEAVAANWIPLPGDAVRIGAPATSPWPPSKGLGPANGVWIVSELYRRDLLEPTVEITCMQPLPSLPEPATGGTLPAIGVGAGAFQSVGGATAARKALAFALSKVGHPYSETTALRRGPTYYDCSGLVYDAYLAVGVKIGGPNHTTRTMWPNGAGERVPPGISNLKPGDLVFFGTSVGGTSTHVAMVDTVNVRQGTAKIVEAADPAQGVITDTFTPTVGASYGQLVYLGATRPSP